MNDQNSFSNYRFAEHCVTAADMIEDIDKILFDFSVRFHKAFRPGQVELLDSIRTNLFEASRQFNILANISRAYNDVVRY